MADEGKQRKLYIYTEEPDPFVVNPRCMCYGYLETADAITAGLDEVHTTQLAFLNHWWIYGGYDIHLIDRGLDYVFDRKWMDTCMPKPVTQVTPYFLLEQYKLGAFIMDQPEM